MPKIEEMEGSRKDHTVRMTPRNALLFLAAILSAALVREGSHPSITMAIIWLPSGVAVAGLWLLGLEAWWVVALGTIVQRALIGYPIEVIVPAGVGSTAEAIVGSLILRRFGVRPTFARLRDVGGLIIAAVVAPIASILFSWLARSIPGPVQQMAFYSGWDGWWRMNALGLLLLVPLAGTWSDFRRASFRPKPLFEALSVTGALMALVWLVMTSVGTGPIGMVLLYLTLPVTMYAAVRFGPRGAATTAAVAVLLVAYGTTHGVGPFLNPQVADPLDALQAFEVTMVIIPLVLGALLAERHDALVRGLRSDTLREAFQQILPDITYVLSGEGVYLDMFVPPGAMVAFPREQVIGRTLEEVVPDFAREMRGLIERALAGAPAQPIEYTVNGRVREARYVRLGEKEVLALVRDITDRKHTESMLEWQARVLELIATGRQTSEVLDSLVRGMEVQLDGSSCSVLLLEGNRFHLGAAPSLPAAYNMAIEGLAIGPSVGSCGTAAYRNERVVVEDIATDPLWESFRDLALSHGLRACWSLPIRSGTGDVLGTFAIYYRTPRSPSETEMAIAERATALAGIAIERERREDLLASINRNVNEGLYRSTPSRGLIYVNVAFARMFGYDSPEAMLQVPSPMLYADPERREELKRVIALRGCFDNEEVRFVRRDGSTFWALVSSTGVKGIDGSYQYYDGAVSDITERKRLEEQLRQAQKMEAVGKLAGGVAHDFNNLLTAISGYAEALTDYLPRNSQAHDDAEEISRAAQRAAALTRQLLAYSRQQILAPQVLDLPLVVDQLGGMLRRLIGEDLRLVIQHLPGECFVRVDRGQIEQVLLNLVVNARDALPNGGTITISTARAEIGATRDGALLDLAPGRYVCLTVADTGTGMDEATRRRAFDPFFTTKALGKGTGLGLSTVYGIVRQSEGSVQIDSTPGSGTTVRVYLPWVEERPEDLTPDAREKPALEAGGVIMVVEDEELVRDLVCRTLRRAGYTVLVADDGEEALRVSGAYPGAIDLMISDVIMPRMGGRELADRIIRLRPTLRILFVSGYANDASETSGALGPGAEYLQKPFTPSMLVDRVREMLMPDRARS
jgi:PAS domain S-box-containing protein